MQWLAGIAGISLTDRIAPVLVASNVNYRKPIEWPNEIVVELFIEKMGNSSLTMGHRMLASEDRRVLYSDGSVVMVWIDTQTGKSVPLPEAVRAACADSDQPAIPEADSGCGFPHHQFGQGSRARPAA